MPNDKEFELDDLESFSFDDLSLDEAPPATPDESEGDPFGVWVKSAPEDVALDADLPLEDPLADELALDAAEPAPSLDSDPLPEEDFLSSEELANLDDSFDFVTVSEEPLEGETPLEDEIAFLDTPEAVAAEKAAPVESSFDEVSLDDFVSFDEVSVEEAPAFVSEEVTSGLPASTEEELTEEFLDIDIDIEDDIGDEELEIIEGAGPRVADDMEEMSLDSFSAQEVDLSEFGDFEEVTPVAEGPLAGADDLPEVLDLPQMDDFAAITAEIELPEDESQSFDIDDGTFEETVLEDGLPSLTDDGPVPLDLEPDDHTDLDHILALEEDLTSGIRPQEPKPEPTADSSPTAAPSPTASQPSDLAAMILGKIEQELSSIKQEITELKKEVTHLRTTPVPASSFTAPLAEAPLPAVEAVSEPEVVESKPHGFFDEEDDETIALTGDELDNILSTAEISEGEEQGLSLDEDLLGMDAEGNLLDPVTVESATTEALHVTDEEFFAGTALDLNAPEEDQGSVTGLAEMEITDLDDPGIPESIELEEGLPVGLEEGETEDLLASSGAEDDFEVAPLPEGLLEGTPEPLEIPFDDDIGLELEDSAPLAPELGEEISIPSPTESREFDSVPETLDLPSLSADPEGWSPSPSTASESVIEEPMVEEEQELELTLEDEPQPVFEAPVPLAAAPVAPIVDTGAATTNTMSAGLKEELKAVLQYMDKLLASLPDDKIQEFAESEHFEVYKRLFEELGLIE